MSISMAVIPMGDVADVLPILPDLAPAFTFREGRYIPPPEHGYDRMRQQYSAMAFLDEMRARGHTSALALTHVDIYVPRRNFVFGLAETGGGLCVVSTARLKHPNRKIYHERVGKEVVHELGHTLGLGHCDEPECVMRFSMSIVDTDAKTAWYCDRCVRLAGTLPQRV